ncbi:unnamed protein product [Adineta steineri]|uniref:Uncharacterized protein n=1 Tax=Adineta steineri TaxID=433720 RepID=A0A815FLA3_9BILA|nr:unnamed protein product [Adineta steineri]
MKQVVLLCIAIAILATVILARPENNIDDFDVEHEIATEFLKRTVFHPGKTQCEEQKREASEKYEERCEPSVNKLTGSRYLKNVRYCPELSNWEDFATYEIGDGGILNLDDLRPNIKIPSITELANSVIKGINNVRKR